jgi:catechol 2,3-dioxygenase-like lactoylglutathione lyase family enzyme
VVMPARAHHGANWEDFMQNMITMVTVSDMERSVRFYRDTLGLKLRFQSPDWSEFDLGPTTLALHGGGTPAPPPLGQRTVGGTSEHRIQCRGPR